MRSAEAGAGLPPSPPLPGALQTWLLWRWPFSFLPALRRRYGPRFTIHALARPPLVFLSDLAEAKKVFAASPELLRPGEGGATIMPIVGERSFMLADDEKHWLGRRMLSPAFSQRAVDAHAETIRELAEREVATWPRGVPFALHDRLRALTLRVILHTLFGADVERVPELHGRLLSMLGMTAGVGLTLPVSRSLPGGRASWRRFLADRAAVDAMLLHLLEARRERPGGQHDALATLGPQAGVREDRRDRGVALARERVALVADDVAGDAHAASADALGHAHVHRSRAAVGRRAQGDDHRRARRAPGRHDQEHEEPRASRRAPARTARSRPRQVAPRRRSPDR